MEKNENTPKYLLFWPELNDTNFSLPCFPQIIQEKFVESVNKINTSEDLNEISSEGNISSKKIKFISYPKKNKISFTVSRKTKRKEDKKQDKSNGRWTKEERIKFAFGLYIFGVDWKKIQKMIPTRTNRQLRSHAQKFLIKLKSNENIKKKKINLTNLSWKNIYDLLKKNLNNKEFLSLLYSIESELEDNKRMTLKYIERKNFLDKAKSSSEHYEPLISTFDENNSNISEEELKENKLGIFIDQNQNNNLINLDEYNILKDNIFYENDNILYDKYFNNFYKNLEGDNTSFEFFLK